MSSELIKKLELAKLKYAGDLVKVAAEDFCEGFMEGIQAATSVVKEHEAQQMKEPLDKSSQIALDQAKDIYLRSKANWELVIYGIDKHSHAKKSHVISRLAEWAIEQEKLEEEK
ncbi:hypothetical protein ED407_02940 [Listeria monocytogenes]|nr:hypothetical protein [Listeria monocytogenes]EAD5322737.1 hypothetical protein [Listeria monocytogenes]EAE9197188.1 hypothetical protein [Listeria monocytogenes]EAE9206258.1 hypothetical protein [Listeria monocytogenes]